MPSTEMLEIGTPASLELVTSPPLQSGGLSECATTPGFEQSRIKSEKADHRAKTSRELRCNRGGLSECATTPGFEQSRIKSEKADHRARRHSAVCNRRIGVSARHGL